MAQAGCVAGSAGKMPLPRCKWQDRYWYMPMQSEHDPLGTVDLTRAAVRRAAALSKMANAGPDPQLL